VKASRSARAIRYCLPIRIALSSPAVVYGLGPQD
jgi:hypothetical protein